METERICPNCRKPLPPDVPLGLCPECLIKCGFPTGTEPEAGTAGRFVPPPVEEIAKLFPQFEILSLIGKGGMGAVYKARQPALDRFVALKVLPPAVANDPGFAERFNREARALARLSHPNIVVVYDFGKAGTLHYLVMEFVDGANLREVERAEKLSPEQALAIVPQICEALQFAHNEGIVHRDIKPENLLVDKKGRVKITDFGIAKILGATEGKVSLTGAKDIMGTPHYMAPEQIEKPQTVDHRADIYSLGVVFYEMLTGELPLGKFAPPSKKAAIDARLDEVVLHTLEKEPGQRYQQASQVKTDVETIAAGATPPPIGPRATPGAAPRIPPVPPQPVASERLILPAFLLAFFFGIFGAHRFYVGKIRSGLLQLAGLGGCVFLVIVCATIRGNDSETVSGILLATLICGCCAWAVIDWIMILCKVFTDGNGLRLVNWWHPDPNTPQPPRPPTPPKMGVATPGGGSNAMILAPGVGLIIAGGLKLVGALIGILYLLCFGAFEYHHFFFFIPGFIRFLSPLIGVSVLLFSIIPAAVILYGGIEMFRLRSYGWAVAASIVAILFCSLIGTPVGIWALIVLLMTGVRETFGNRPAAPPSYKGLLILGAAAAACLLLFLTVCFFTFLTHMHGSAASSSFARAMAASPMPAIPPLPPMPPTAPGSVRLVPILVAAPLTNALTGEAERQLALEQMSEYPDEQSIQKQSAALLAQIDEASAELARTRQQYATGLTSSMKLQLAEDKKKLAEAERLLALQTPAFEQKRITVDAYQQDLNDVVNGLAKIGADEAATTNVPDPNTSSNFATATGTGLINYQWYVGSTNSASVSTNPPGSPTAAGTVPLYYQWYVAPTNNAGSTGTQTIPIYEKDDVGDSRDFSKAFAVDPNGDLTMDVDRGDVHITGGDGNTVEIHIRRDVRGASDADASDILKKEHVVVEHTGNQISITSQNPFDLHTSSWWGQFKQQNLEVHYEVTVPRSFTVESKTSGGGMKVGGVRGKADIATMGGELECTDMGGSVDGKTMGGSVHSRGCSGELELQTMGGDITVDDFTGPSVQATTSGGSVSADFANAPTADCDLHTMGGNVTIHLPDTAAVTLNGHTMGGEVKTDFAVPTKEGFGNDSVDSPINGGGPTLKMDTTGGNIEVWKR